MRRRTCFSQKRTLVLLLAAVCAVSELLLAAHGFSLTQDVGYLRDQRQRKGLEVEGSAGDDGELWFERQLVDHFDFDNEDTWSQRYFMNDTFYDSSKQPNPLVFLCVGGEGPALQPSVVVTGGVHCAWMIHLAQEFGALIVAVEHRFYGKSLPKPDYTNESLKFLSSRQALEDIALFRQYVTQTYGLQQNAKWITFGGSYPGMMASWARLKYPDLFYASVSSSAPVQAELNMQGYNDVVAFSMNDTTVGGSPTCLANIKSAFSALGEKLQGSDSDITAFASQYNVCNPYDLLDSKNQKMFLEGFWGLFPLQSNDPACSSSEYCNYQQICDLFDSSPGGKSPSDNLHTLFTSVYGTNQCYDIKWSSMLDSLENVNSQDRSWIWQTCTEFGFYQTCDPGTSCPFTTSPWRSTVQSYLDICEQVFEISSEITEKQVNLSNVHYGGWKYGGTNVFFVNGDVDPWHANAVLSPNNDYQQTLMVKGASHHFWTHPPKPTDQQSVQMARTAIEKQVASWIAQSAFHSTEQHQY